MRRFPTLRRIIPVVVACALSGCGESSGLVSALDTGQGVSAAVSEVVVTPKVDTIFVTDSLALADVAVLKATVIGFAGQVIANPSVRWSTADTGVVTVDTAGVVRPRRTGTATVIAKSGNKEARATVVVAYAVRRLLVTPAAGSADTISVRDTVRAIDLRQLKALALGATGDTVRGVRFTWTSSNPQVATVDSTGLVRPTGRPGTTTITVQGGGLPAVSRTIVVRSIVASVQTSAPPAQALPQDTARLTATVRGVNGAVLTDVPVRWSSSNPAVATIDSLTGFVRFLTPGTVTFTATAFRGSLVQVSGTTVAQAQVLPLQFLSVDAGWDHTCATATLGRVYCWGRRAEGQLGVATADTVCADPEAANAPTDCSLVPKRAASTLDLVQVSAGDSTTCAMARDGRAYCWGANTLGRLGNGSMSASRTPTLVTSAVTFTRVSVGTTHACGIDTRETAWCWGADSSGQLGREEFFNANQLRASSTTPIPVDRTGWLAISAGHLHTCAIDRSSDAYCWGSNASGQLGFSGGSVASPRLVSGGLKYSAISASTTDRPKIQPFEVFNAYTCGLVTDGRVVCWGANAFGQASGTGVGGAVGPTVIALPGTGRASAISAGGELACALLTSGQVSCWGRTDFTGNVAPRIIDLGGLPAEAISVGRRHACAIVRETPDTRWAYCWGSDVLGALGDQLQALARSGGVRVTDPLAAPSATSATAARAGR